MNMAAAFSDMALGFSAAFGGPFVAAKLHHAGTAVMDAGGSIVTPGTPTARNCSAQVDIAGQSMRAQDGFADGDVSIIVLAATLIGPISTDERIEILTGPFAGVYSVESVGRDTASIGFELRGRPMTTPTFIPGMPE